jgi:hypothetical protein
VLCRGSEVLEVSSCPGLRTTAEDNEEHDEGEWLEGSSGSLAHTGL